MKEDLKNSERFINKKAGKKTGFSVPTVYFENIEDVILSKINTNKIPTETGFQLPKNYFYGVENRIIEKIHKKKEPQIVNFKRTFIKIVPYLAAASIALFISLKLLFFKNSNNFNFDSISNVDIENWIDTSTFTNDDIYTILDDDFLNTDDFVFTNFKTKNIEDYLNSIDDQELLTEYY